MMHEAVYAGYVDVMGYLCEVSPSLVNTVDYVCLLEYDDDVQYGNTPLHEAVMRNRIDALRVLIEHGGDVNRVNKVCENR